MIEAIPAFHTSNVILSNSSRFAFIGSIPESMLHNVPADNEVIKAYRKKPASGPRRLTAEMQKALEEAENPKKGGKRKAKVGPFEPAHTPTKKVKRIIVSLSLLH